MITSNNQTYKITIPETDESFIKRSDDINKWQKKADCVGLKYSVEKLS